MVRSINDSNAGNVDGVLPKGSVVYKKAFFDDPGEPSRRPTPVVVTLVTLSDGVVPNNERRSCKLDRRTVNSLGRRSALRKCRVPLAAVVSIEELKPSGRRKLTRFLTSCRSQFQPKFFYRVGEIVRPTYRFDGDPTEICTSGIHVFRTRREAELW